MSLNLPTEIMRIEPIAITRKSNSGRTEPLEMQCNSYDNGMICNYMIKLYTKLELGYFSCGNELLGSILAIAFDLCTPEPAIAEINLEFCNHYSNKPYNEALQGSIGLNFGSKLIETGANEFQFLSDDLFQEAFEIFAFDTLIMNPDRIIGRPNMFQQPSRLVIFDHEMAFQYGNPNLFLFGQVPDPWDINYPTLKNHILYKYLKGKPIIYDSFIEKLDGITDDFITEMFDLIPDDWMDENRAINIRNYLRSASQNKDSYLRELKGVLS